jgi:hypothetical protein
MTTAFAKALGLEVQYQSVDVNETWSRDAWPPNRGRMKSYQ